MSERTPVVVPRENVNDETATLVAWYVPSGSAVAAGQDIAQVETSKAVLEIAAPASGILRYTAKPGLEVPVGGEIAHVGGPEEAVIEAPAAGSPAPLPAPEPAGPVPAEEDPSGAPGPSSAIGLVASPPSGNGHAAAAVAAPAPASAPARFSRKARAWIEEHGLDPARFEGRGLVRLSDLVGPSPEGEAPPGAEAPATAPARPGVAEPVVAASGVATRAEPLSRAKRTEGRYLRSGLENTLPSVVTVACPTRGLRAAAGEHPEIGDQATALIAFEAARLLRKYPAFNAFHSGGTIRYYESVNIGFAVDAGSGLKVPVVRDADRKAPAEIAGEMRERVVEYLGGTLAVEALAGGTFTITDLSGEGVVSFHPLINRGQSAILGVGGEVFPGGSPQGHFHLILAFDHQVAEGRAAARFLNDLSERLQAHERALRGRAGPSGSAATEEAPYCRRCQLSLGELEGYGRYLVPTLGADGSTRTICSSCLRGA
jgi:pyruvate/2-oxoglutarate dehydrogenase complex dihydrolipoamide acyltransferase (E2) component